MRPLASLGDEEAANLDGLVFDLDDTLLDHGALGEASYAALFRLRESGLSLVACTGRPAGWGEIVARQWPIDVAVVENGALAFARDGAKVLIVGELDARDNEASRRALLEIAETIVAAHPSAALADDNRARLSDVTIDIGEHRRVAREEIAAMVAEARARGVRTLTSSVHLHLTFDTADKASGTLAALGSRFGVDATRARSRWAFAGDSGNDAAAFAAFKTTFAVANVAAHLASLTVPPRYVSSLPMGKGFAEIAGAIVRARAQSRNACLLRAPK